MWIFFPLYSSANSGRLTSFSILVSNSFTCFSKVNLTCVYWGEKLKCWTEFYFGKSACFWVFCVFSIFFPFYFGHFDAFTELSLSDVWPDSLFEKLKYSSSTFSSFIALKFWPSDFLQWCFIWGDFGWLPVTGFITKGEILRLYFCSRLFAYYIGMFLWSDRSEEFFVVKVFFSSFSIGKAVISRLFIFVISSFSLGRMILVKVTPYFSFIFLIKFIADLKLIMFCSLLHFMYSANFYPPILVYTIVMISSAISFSLSFTFISGWFLLRFSFSQIFDFPAVLKQIMVSSKCTLPAFLQISSPPLRLLSIM